MIKFREFRKESTESTDLTETEQLIVLSALMQDDCLNESTEEICESVKGLLGKAGFAVHKSKSIIDYVKKFTSATGKLMLHLIKGDFEKAKDIAKTLEKKDVMDFLIKLDQGTLHLLSGPIHTIDAWTGWHIAVDLGAKFKTAEDKIKEFGDVLVNVKNKIIDLFTGSTQKSMVSAIHKIQARAAV